jgi:DNA ligase (NAD+)
MSTKASIIERLTKARDAYYNGNPILSDAAYDALEDELRQLDPTNSFFKKIGAPVPTGSASKGWKKVNHTIPMSSLNKAQDNSELKSWFSSCNASDVVVMDKLDGASIALRYENQKLVQALTRGDGTTGEDITRNVLLMQGVIKTLPLHSQSPNSSKTIHVRGEIICKKSDFEKYFPGESNPRNTASGTAKRQSDPAKCEHLTVVAYQLLIPGKAQSKQEELALLMSMGFCVPRFKAAKGENAVEAIYQEYVAKTRSSLDYEIDGLVIDIDDEKHREALGELNGRPKSSIAYKFPHEQKATILKNIRWQVGNSGRVTPVAEFDEVQLAGVKVERASLHTARNVRNLKLFPGCRVLISRRNDCIPYLETNLDEKPTSEDV